jgi:DNA-binding MarR family transcriptional regulator
MKRRERERRRESEMVGNIGEPDDSGLNEPLPEALAGWTGNLLYWVSDRGGRFYERFLAPYGLRPPHVAALQILAFDGAMPQARLGEVLRLDKKTMVYLLNDLENLGLAERRPHPDDGRAFMVHLTDHGQERLKVIETASLEADRAFFGAALSPEEQKVLHELLRRLSTCPLSSPPERTENR